MRIRKMKVLHKLTFTEYNVMEFTLETNNHYFNYPYKVRNSNIETRDQFRNSV